MANVQTSSEPDSKSEENGDANVITVCVIGAGPSGLSVLNAFNKELERLESAAQPPNFKVICFEKQPQLGGLWRYDWRTGSDEHGVAVHGSMYRNLWSNGPKECLEMSDYTFSEHFGGKEMGSFPPRAVIYDYLMGRVQKRGLCDKFDIRLSHHVLDVQHRQNGTFDVKYHDVKQDVHGSIVVDHLVVASGHFSVPNIVEFKGFEAFNGRILHSHSFRNALNFRGQNVLVIGGSYSAEDIALQCWKFGSKSVTISVRSGPTGLKWPDGVQEVPLLKEVVDGHEAVFVDGQRVRGIDSIILCTGYLHSFPFLPNELRLKTKNVLYPRGLYKGVIRMGTPNLLYIGMPDQWYTFSMFDVQALFAKDVILGRVALPDPADMRKDVEKWCDMAAEARSEEAQIAFQTQYILDLYASLLKGAEYVDDAKKLDYSQEFGRWEDDRHHDIITHRNGRFTSKVSGKTASQFATEWKDAFDDSIEAYLDEKAQIIK